MRRTIAAVILVAIFSTSVANAAPRMPRSPRSPQGQEQRATPAPTPRCYNRQTGCIIPLDRRSLVPTPVPTRHWIGQ